MRSLVAGHVPVGVPPVRVARRVLLYVYSCIITRLKGGAINYVGGQGHDGHMYVPPKSTYMTMSDSSLEALARGDPAGFHQYGQKLYQNGDHVKAIEVFTQVISTKLDHTKCIL